MIIQKPKDCFKRLAEAFGKKHDDCYSEGKAVVGCWKLDCNPFYGGCVIEEIASESGGIIHPVVPFRLPPKQFCQAVKFAEGVLEIERKRPKS